MARKNVLPKAEDVLETLNAVQQELHDLRRLYRFLVSLERSHSRTEALRKRTAVPRQVMQEVQRAENIEPMESED